jgi:MFS family permease
LPVLCAVQLMVLLDGAIVNIALPTISGALRLEPDDASWVVTSYYLAFGGLLPLGGRVGDLLGRRRVLIAGTVLFTVASLLGGLAGSGTMLLVTRVLQGVGAAAAAPNVLALLTTTFTDPRARARAIAVYAVMSGVGIATGLTAGGLLTEWVSWRWIFLVNVPLGLAVLALAPRVLAETARRRDASAFPAGPGSTDEMDVAGWIDQTGRVRGTRRPVGGFDLAGAVLVTAGITTVVYALARVQSAGWSDPWTRGSFGLAALCLLLSARVEARGDTRRRSLPPPYSSP